MVFDSELRMATHSLPLRLQVWMERALRSGWYTIGSGVYEDSGSGRVCPIVAAATMAGLWRAEGLSGDDPAWGTAAGPSESVEEFAAYFDLHSEEHGIQAAVAVVIAELGARTHLREGVSLAPGQVRSAR